MNQIIATDKYSVVVGFGATGQSVARFLEKEGVNFCVADTRDSDQLHATFTSLYPNRKLFMGELDEALLVGAQTIVLSPGVSRKEPAVKSAIEAGVPVVGDIQLFLNATSAPTIGITGSNGKTTVTTLLGRIAKRAGVNAIVGGNIGTPALDLLKEGAELNILELSSFQLDSTEFAALSVACVLNVTPDHMDRYDSLQEYMFSKQRIYRGASSIVFNRDDSLSEPPKAEGVARASFGLKVTEASDAINYTYDKQNGLIKRNRDAVVGRDKIKMVGDHNVANALAVLAVAEMAGIAQVHVLDELAFFGGLPHRCEWIATKNSVTFINDSKGTNIGATVAAITGLSSQYNNLILIAGGDGKNADFSVLGSAISVYVKALVTMGIDGDAIRASVGDKSIATRSVTSMAQAVSAAFELAKPGDAVLLSPACASFDMFRGYEHRGECFREAVESLC